MSAYRGLSVGSTCAPTARVSMSAGNDQLEWEGTECNGREETARTHGHEGRPAKDARLHTSFFRSLAFRQRHLKNNDPICLR